MVRFAGFTPGSGLQVDPEPGPSLGSGVSSELRCHRNRPPSGRLLPGGETIEGPACASVCLRRIRVGMIADVTTTIPEAATGTDRAEVMARAAVLTRDAAARC